MATAADERSVKHSPRDYRHRVAGAHRVAARNLASSRGRLRGYRLVEGAATSRQPHFFELPSPLRPRVRRWWTPGLVDHVARNYDSRHVVGDLSGVFRWTQLGLWQVARA